MSEPEDSKMPLLDHLIELRRRLLWSVLAMAVAFGVSIYFARPIFGFLVQPLLASGQSKMIYTAIFEAFFVEIKVAFFAASFVSFPVFATQLWKFVAPGLYTKEKRAFLPFLLATPLLFTAGAAMAYYMAIHRADIFAGLRRKCRRRATGSIAGRRQLPQLCHEVHLRLWHFVLVAGVADAARKGRDCFASATEGRATLCNCRIVCGCRRSHATRCSVAALARNPIMYSLRTGADRNLAYAAQTEKSGLGNRDHFVLKCGF